MKSQRNQRTKGREKKWKPHHRQGKTLKEKRLRLCQRKMPNRQKKKNIRRREMTTPNQYGKFTKS